MDSATQQTDRPSGTTNSIDSPAPSKQSDAFRFGFFFALGTAVLALLLFLGWKLLDAIAAIATPFVGAVILSLLLEPLIHFVQSKATGGHRMRAVILVFLVFLSFLGGALSYAGPALITQAQRLVRFFTPVTYKITRSSGAKDRFVTVTDGIVDTSFVVKNLGNDTNYNFIVYAVNAEGEQFASPVASGTPNEDSSSSASDIASNNKGTAPLKTVSLPARSPQSLTAHPGNGTVRLTWQPPIEGQSGLDVLRSNVDKWLAGHHKVGPIALPKDTDAVTAQYSDQISQSLKLSAGRVTNLIIGSVSSLVTVLLVPIISIFILSDLDRLRARFYMLLPEQTRKFTQIVFLDVAEVFGKYLRGLVIICSLYGGACMVYLLGVSLWFPGLRGYALLLGVLAGVLYSVPYIGAISTVLLTAVAAFSTGSNIGGALIAAGGVLALNQIFDYVVMPKVVGETAGIHPLLAMFALFLGGHLFGLWGMLIAVPIAASVQGVLFRLYPRLAAPTPISLMKPVEREDIIPAEVPKTPRESESEGQLISSPHE